MIWSASYARSVESDITKLPADLRDRFISALEQILANPFVGKKLKGSKDRYSVRMGRDFRIVYNCLQERARGRY